MNYSLAVFLINKNARAVLATYEAEETAKRTLFKTLDPTIAVGDFVIVPTNTRHKMTVVKVVEADVDVDFESRDQVEWIIGRVDSSGFKETLAQEGQALTAIKSAELRKKRDDLRQALFADHIESLKALPITAMNGDTAELAKE